MRRPRVVVVGAGMGGLTAALRLALRGCEVRLCEARSEPGGLASAVAREGLEFDGGPYILLDRPGLEWAFRELGMALAERVELRRIEDVYRVEAGDAPPVRFRASLEETAQGLEESWPGSARRYAAFVERTAAVYRRLTPLLFVSRPGLRELVAGGALRDVPFLLRPLRSILASTGLPAPVRDAIGIWTHVAGQRLSEAPSPLAFVPALLHTVGSFFAPAGIASIPRALAAAAESAGCELRYGCAVRAIRLENGRARGVETERGESLDADAIVTDVGLGTYLSLLPRSTLPARRLRKLERLPLQSPGVSAYLAVRRRGTPPYLRFTLPGGESLCRLLVQPALLRDAPAHDGWYPARLLAPMRHADAERGAELQRAFLEEVLAEPWWREAVGAHRVLATRIPDEWGREMRLHSNAMNPVMTASFMRAGRLSHRSPHLRGLYLAGSATHPGQWVSFCAISGILVADRLLEDLG